MKKCWIPYIKRKNPKKSSFKKTFLLSKNPTDYHYSCQRTSQNKIIANMKHLLLLVSEPFRLEDLSKNTAFQLQISNPFHTALTNHAIIIEPYWRLFPLSNTVVYIDFQPIYNSFFSGNLVLQAFHSGSLLTSKYILLSAHSRISQFLVEFLKSWKIVLPYPPIPLSPLPLWYHIFPKHLSKICKYSNFLFYFSCEISYKNSACNNIKLNNDKALTIPLRK